MLIKGFRRAIRTFGQVRSHGSNNIGDFLVPIMQIAVGAMFEKCVVKICIQFNVGFKSPTVLREVLGDRARLCADVVIALLVLTFLIVLTIECVKLIMMPFVASQTSVVLGLPIPILYASAPVGAGLSAIRVVQHLIRTLRLIADSKG